MKRREGGFTLIEVMIAVAVMTLMMVIAWGSVIQTLSAKKQFEKQQDRFREARGAMQRMVSDLEAAYISANEDRTLMDTRTFFVGEATGDINSLRFSSFAHQKLYADANEGDQTIVSYYPASDKVNRSQQNLMRRETRRLGNEKYDTLSGEADVLFSNVTKVKFSYFEIRENEWKDSWSTQGVEGSNGRLPDRVRISVTFPDENGKDVTLTTQAKLHISEMLLFIPRGSQ